MTRLRLATLAVAATLPLAAGRAAGAPPRRASPPAAWATADRDAPAGATRGHERAAAGAPAALLAGPGTAAAAPSGQTAAVVPAATLGDPPPVARAAPVAPVAAPPAQTPAPEPAPVRKALEKLEVVVHGDLYLTGRADARDEWARELALGRARIEVEGRAGALRTVIEADVADRDPLKDAYARLDGRGVRLVAGQFKAPFLERETLSSWRLPTVDRGLVADYLVERNALGGRHIGVVGALRPWGGALDVSAGVFQGTAAEDARAPQDYAARVAVRPVAWLTVGASGYLAGRSRDTPAAATRRAADAFVSVEADRLTATAEGLAGDLEQGAFRAGLALVQYAFPLGERVRLAPLAGAEALRLSGARTGSGAVVGAVLSYGRDLKLKVQGERARRPGDDALRNAIALELATRF